MFTDQESKGTETIEFGPGKTESSVPTQTVESENGTIEYSAETETESEDLSKETSSDEKSPKEDESGNKETIDVPQKQEDKSQTPTFKVNRKTSEKESKTEVPQAEDNKEAYSVTDESVIRFLKTKGLDVKSLDEVAKKTKLPDAVEEFKRFNEKTGRGISAFYNSKKDWKEEPKRNTLKEFYKHQNPNATDDDINTQLELLELSEDEELELSERELKKRRLEYNGEYSKALKFMQDLSKEYNIPNENQAQQKPPTDEEIVASHRPYWEQRDKSLEKLNEINLPIDGLGDIVLPVTEEQKELISRNTQTFEGYFDRWKKEGTLKEGETPIDTDKSTLDVAWSIPEIRDQFISDMLSQAHALTIENFSKDKRNVTLGKHKIDSTSQASGSMDVYSSKNQESTMGQPLIPRR